MKGLKTYRQFRLGTSRFQQLIVALFGVLLWHSGHTATDIRASLDRNPVRLNESFSVTFTADHSPDGEPDFSVLEQDFEILNQSQSSNISLVNGNYSKSVTWTLTLMAKKSGHLVIPSVAFGDDRSNPQNLSVLGAANNRPRQDSDILLEVKAEPENPYVQAQVLYTVQFLRRVDIAQASLTEPDLNDAIVQKLGEDRSFSTWRNGSQYAVTERKYAIFPQQSGLVAIPPLEMKVDVVVAGRRGFFSRRSTQVRRYQSNPVALDVRPIPAEFDGDYWFPAERVDLQGHWSTHPPTVAVGEPITRTLRLSANGAPMSLLPELEKIRFSGADANHLKQYPDQPTLDEKVNEAGIVSTREQKTAIIPAKPGSFRVSAIEIPWWNTQKDRMEVARVSGITVQINPSATQQVEPQQLEPVIPRDTPAERAQPVVANRLEPAIGDTVWIWIALGLAFGWVCTLIYLIKLKIDAKRGEDSQQKLQSISERQSLRKLKQACRKGELIQAKNALLAWGQVRWPDSPPRNLAAVAARCDRDIGTEISAMSQSLYGPQARSWNGDNCWAAIENYLRRTEPKPRKRQQGLEPLFKT